MSLNCVGKVCASLFFVIGIVSGEEFSDDFTQAANTNWLASADYVKMKIENGICSIDNQDMTYTGFALHSLSSKPSTFSLTGKITLAEAADQTAGFICCLAIQEGKATGYSVTITDNEKITVNKFGASGSGSNVLTKGSAYLTTGANELKISRKENKFNVFCNGKFVATFTDSDFSSGDIALLVAPKSSAVFDDVALTETFEEGAAPTCFSDNFDDGDLLGWDSFGSGGGTVKNSNNAMSITTNADQIYQVIDLPLENFVLRAVVSHHGGNVKSLYGLFVCGMSEASIPVAGFGINGGRNYAAFVLGGQAQLNQSTKVKGAPLIAGTDTTFYRDTLEVIKREGVQEYLFIINGDTLSRFTGVNFSITGAGVFCHDSLTLVVDDFLVAEGANPICPIKHSLYANAVKGGAVFQGPGVYQFDPLGRIVSRTISINNRQKATGIYVLRQNGISQLRMNTRR